MAKGKYEEISSTESNNDSSHIVYHQKLNKLNSAIEKAHDCYKKHIVLALFERSKLNQEYYSKVEKDIVKTNEYFQKENILFLQASINKEEFNNYLDNLVDNADKMRNILNSLTDIKSKISSDNIDHFEYLVIEKNNLDLIKFLFEKADYNFKSVLERYTSKTNKVEFEGYTLLHHAVVHGSQEIVDYLIETCKLDVEKTTTNYYYNSSPLLFAIEYNHTDLAKHLVNHHKADPNLINDVCIGSLYTAIMYNNLEMTKFLVEKFEFHLYNLWDANCNFVFSMDGEEDYSKELIQFLLEAVNNDKIKASISILNNFINALLESVFCMEDDESEKYEKIKIILQNSKVISLDQKNHSMIQCMKDFAEYYNDDPEINRLISPYINDLTSDNESATDVGGNIYIMQID